MIIFENHSWQTRTDKPNENWLSEFADVEQPKYVVDDNSELADKIMSTPQFVVVEDDNGNIVDIEPVIDPNAELYERQTEIKARLSEIDSLEIRPLAAIMSGTGNDEDTNRLKKLESEKTELRNELSVVVASLTDVSEENPVE